MISRRQFIQRVGLLGGVLLTPLGRLVRRYSQEPAEEEPQPEGELYAGFVLLPEGASLPYFVSHPTGYLPNMCGVGRTQDSSPSNAVVRMVDSVKALSREVGFPLFSFRKLPHSIELGSAMLIGNTSGAICAACLGYEKIDNENLTRETIISIWALPDYYRPFPIWRRDPIEESDKGLIPIKVNFLSNSGIMMSTQEGAIFYWINENILYILDLDSIPASFEPQTFVADLGIQVIKE